MVAALMMDLVRRALLAPALRMRMFLLFCLPAAYLVLRDSLGGKSIGKFMFGLTTWNVEDRKPAGFAESVLRNWLLSCVILPPYITVFRLTLSFGMLLCAFVSLLFALQILFGGGRRIGDGTAGTIVVEDRLTRRET